ncbi:hypothetical protein Cme02nite_49030 [Catellatospora methionotrophica]|uniref:Uncharacterized protein n=1 Tax=Catellatospora methionotrophica TaxID=121620 RepID=A0A8J3PIN0_9ACTN|nr:hypothetical protein [Catellatospora methionotrophica]GIG16571.1 hypothetical protein Cme02nite_49030 [Catellatospora methionotrophica]
MSALTRRSALGLFTATAGLVAMSPATAAKAACGSIPSTADPAVLSAVYAVATELGASERVLLAGFEAGWVESHMNNLNCGDRDSLGVFQQRPSQGWGTAAQILDVRFASNSFFSRAIPLAAANPSWSPGQVAQGVQRSAFPTRYDEARPVAEQLLAQARATGARQVYEAASNNGWRALAVGGPSGPVTGSATAAISLAGTKIVYSLRGGQVFEAASSTGWNNLWTGISGAQGTALAAVTLNNVKYIYTVVGGYVHEAHSANGWRNLNTGIGGVGTSSISVIALNGVIYIYSIVGGWVHEAHSANGWRNLNTGVPASAVAAIAQGTTKIIYSVNGGAVYEAASNAGWTNRGTGITGVSSATIAATANGAEKLIYTSAGGYIHEASSNTGWRNLNSGVPGSRTAAMAVSGVKYLYSC